MSIWYVSTAGAGNKDGTSYADRWDTFANMTWGVGGIVADDTLYVCGTMEEQMTVGDSGSSGSPITIRGDYSGDAGIIKGSGDLTSAIYKWTVSGNGTNEYYCELAGGGDPGLSEAKIAFMDSTRLVNGTIGSLNDHEWDWGDNDTLGYSTVYVRDDSGDPDVTGITLEAGQRDNCTFSDGKDYITIRDLTAKHANVTGIQFYNGCDNLIVDTCVAEHNYQFGIRANGSTQHSNGIIKNNTVRYNGEFGIIVNDNAHSYTTQKNAIHNNGWATELQWTGGIKLWGGNNSDYERNNIIEQNLVYSNGAAVDDIAIGSGIWIDECATTSGNAIIIRHNEVYQNTSFGIQIEKSDYVEVYGNVVYENSQEAATSAGISVLIWGTEDAENNKIYNNVVYGNLQYGIECDGNDRVGSVAGNIIKNNISTGNTSYELHIYGTSATGTVCEYNCFGAEKSNFIYWDDGAHATYDSWETAYGSSTYSIESAPSFADVGNNDYSLQGGSAGIDAGADLGSSFDDGVDSDDDTWPSSVSTLDQDLHGNGWEIGAYVYRTIWRWGD